ncbi:MAG: class I SAM-dependent methyltransferase [Candidatus Aenigmarchaeota archaeon]|nr:class I SAM-dependent methyltransferase [Candidatus Aenigmarchaeota archaeon]
MDQRHVWDNIAEEWSKYREKPFPEVIELTEKMNGAILDIGCGSGRNFLPGKKIVAVDFSIEMLKIAKKKQNCIFVQGDMSCLPFKKDSFDNIVAVAVIHCTPGWKHVLDECYRILKPGARVLITVWDGEQDAFKKQIERGSSSVISGKEITRKWNDYERYYYLFSQKELEGALGKTDFNIIKSEKFIGGHRELFWNLLVLAEKPF